MSSCVRGARARRGDQRTEPRRLFQAESWSKYWQPQRSQALGARAGVRPLRDLRSLSSYLTLRAGGFSRHDLRAGPAAAYSGSLFLIPKQTRATLTATDATRPRTASSGALDFFFFCVWVFFALCVLVRSFVCGACALWLVASSKCQCGLARRLPRGGHILTTSSRSTFTDVPLTCPV